VASITPEKLKQTLHQALANLESYPRCALLDYPDHLNIGDHLIWLGSVLYLTDILKTKIDYAASMREFSGTEMEQRVGKAPIFLHGGGNLGDLWTNSQNFREQIISEYKDRPIIILPQSIYFRDKNNLKKAANIFNSHPNLTIYARDINSYEIALQAFENCQIIKAPDMAFQLIDMPNLSLINSPKSSSILYLCRRDREANRDLNLTEIDLSNINIVVEDWISYQWVLGVDKTQLLRQIATLFREGWQRGLATPREWFSRQFWQFSHPYNATFQNIYNPSIHRRSWSFIYSGIYQFRKHNLVITNRLHGHILCIILGIPHIFLPNAYYKNQSFYKTWTSNLPFCRFIEDPAQIQGAVQELLKW
jgi:pyruvyl transferase EpsO